MVIMVVVRTIFGCGFVYYESRNRELKTRPIYECLFCSLWTEKARVKDKTNEWESVPWVSMWWKNKNETWGIYTSHIHWVSRGTGTPKDKDDINRRDVCECDGWVCVLEMMGVPSK